MIEWTVRHTTTVLLSVFAIVLFGSASYCSLPREASPDITIPFLMVTTPYPGASPADIEGLVTNPMENELTSLRNVKEMVSVSSEGISMVTIEFEPDVVIEDALQRTRDRVNRARPKLPEDVDQTEVREISFSDIPVLLVTVAGDADQEQLKELAESVEDDVKRIPGVLSTGLAGGLSREIQVLIDPGRLNYYGFSFNDVLGALQSENVNIPGGAVSRQGGDVILRVPRTFQSAQDIEQVAVKRVGDQPVFIRDLGRVTDGYASRTTYARMNGRPAVTLSVTKRAGANIIDVADAIKLSVDQHAESWPAGVEYRILADQSVHIRNMITELQNNIFTALLLVVCVLLFFMGTRNSLFVALAIPLSMLISFAILNLLGFTLNMVVLFSLILALGMLVDNAIVVVENIYRHLELGYSHKEAAIKGTKEVAVAIAASTATTVAAFFPMVFWGGIMGEFMSYLPKTVIIVLLSSLVVAICILPVATSKMMRAARTTTQGDSETALTAAEGSLRWRIMMAYKTLLTASIRYRYVSAGLGLIALLFTSGVYYFMNHGTELFSNVEPDRAVINVRAPVGTKLDWTDQVTRQIEGFLATKDNVDVWTAESGVSGSMGGLGGDSASTNQARITVDFLPHATMAKPDETPRVESTFDTIQSLRDDVAVIPGVEISVEKEEMGPPVGPDIEVIVMGDDFHAVGQYAQRIKRDLSNIEGLTEFSDDYRVNRPELALRTDRGAAKRVGISSGVIGNTVRTALAGTTATTIRDRDTETDVVVRLAPEFRDDVQSILSLRLPGREDTSPDTFPVPLSSVASYDMTGGTGSIRHIDQDLAVTITADIPDNYNINAVQAAVAKRLELYRTGTVQAGDTANYTDAEIASLKLPESFHVKMAGAMDEQQETVAFLSWAFMLAIALITIILVTQFDSLAMPLIILGTVVLSLIGVLWGLLLTGMPFGVMMTGIGIISLAGVVVNNAIVLLDYVKQLRKKGHSVEEALIRAGMIRFRPVILTAITTILGLIPMAIGVAMEINTAWFGSLPVPYLRLLLNGQSAGWWGPMAVAVIFGLAFATVLTLVMVPTLYSIFWDISKLRSRVLGKAIAAATALFLLCVTATSPDAHATSFEEAWLGAQSNNMEIKSLAERAKEARTQQILTWGYVSPNIQLHGAYTFNQYEAFLDMGEAFQPLMSLLPPGTDLDFGDPIVIQPKRFFTGGLSLSQPLINASTTTALISSKRNLRATDLDVARDLQRIKAQVAQVYYQLLAAREAVQLAEKAEKIAASQLDLAKKQVAAGSVARRTLLQAELRLSQAKRQVLTANEQRINAENRFFHTVGWRAEALSWGDAPGPLPSSLNDALQSVGSQRKDLQADTLHVDVARLNKTVMKLTWMPRIDGTFDLIYTQNTGFVDEPLFWTAAIKASIPIWDGGTRLARIRRAASQTRLAEAERVQNKRAASHEVENAWASHESAKQALVAVEREVELAEENFSLAQRGFEAGQGTWLGVQEAELSLSQTRFNHLNARVALRMSQIALALAVGTY